MNGPSERFERRCKLAREELFAGAGLARDEHVDIGRGDLFHATKHLLQARAAADDVAEALRLELFGDAIAIGGELVEEDRVLQNE